MARTTRRLFTPTEAAALLPLVREQLAILRECLLTAQRLLEGLSPSELASYRSEEELRSHPVLSRVLELQERAIQAQKRLEDKGIELKDPLRGLVDFPAMRGGQEVYLCWLAGEEHISHWHTLTAGFAGRRRIEPGEEGLWEWFN